MLKIYGIPNCDTMKKAFDWLKGRGVAYDFHDYKQAAVTAGQLRSWIDMAGLDKVLNKASTTFKALPQVARQDLTEARAIALMVAQPSMIRRPVIEIDGRLLTGFKPDTIAALEQYVLTAQDLSP